MNAVLKLESLTKPQADQVIRTFGLPDFMMQHFDGTVNIEYKLRDVDSRQPNERQAFVEVMSNTADLVRQW